MGYPVLFALILLLFLAACGLIAWATHAAIVGRIALWSRILFLVALVSSCVGAYYSTFNYTYFANANTRFHGWPVPQVIFQRDGPGEPWLDFVGPTVVLAYPMNVVLFSIVPALLVLVVYLAKRRPETSSTEARVDDSGLGVKPAVETGNPYQTPSHSVDDG